MLYPRSRDRFQESSSSLLQVVICVLRHLRLGEPNLHVSNRQLAASVADSVHPFFATLSLGEMDSKRRARIQPLSLPYSFDYFVPS